MVRWKMTWDPPGYWTWQLLKLHSGSCRKLLALCFDLSEMVALISMLLCLLYVFVVVVLGCFVVFLIAKGDGQPGEPPAQAIRMGLPREAASDVNL